jgi:hypothetical protein
MGKSRILEHAKFQKASTYIKGRTSHHTTINQKGDIK